MKKSHGFAALLCAAGIVVAPTPAAALEFSGGVGVGGWRRWSSPGPWYDGG